MHFGIVDFELIFSRAFSFSFSFPVGVLWILGCESVAGVYILFSQLFWIFFSCSGSLKFLLLFRSVLGDFCSIPVINLDSTSLSDMRPWSFFSPCGRLFVLLRVQTRDKLSYYFSEPVSIVFFLVFSFLKIIAPSWSNIRE